MTTHDSTDRDLFEIRRTHHEWSTAFGAGDSAALASLVTADAEFWTPGLAAISGRPGVAEALGRFFLRYSATQRFDVLELIVSGKWAFERGIERIVVRPRDGSPAVHRDQRAFTVLHRDPDGRWRFARGMTHPDC
jgi:uncharacterized protein (TIGR02246 family)